MSFEGPTAPELTLFRRMLGIFTAPRATFTALSKSTSWADVVVPLAVIMAFALGSQSLLWPVQLEAQREFILRSERIPEDRKDAALERVESRAQGPVAMIIRVVAPPVWFAVIAGIVMFTGSVVLGGQAPFMATFAMVLYANLVGLVEWLVKIPLMLQAQSVRVQTGLSLLLPDTLEGTLIHRFLGHLDLFSMWKIFLLAMGMALLYKVSENRGRQVLFGAWVLAMFLIALVFKGGGIAFGG